jgi:hypothetical protein
MKTRAKVSINGAQRLKGDVDYFKNWIQTSPMVPIVSFFQNLLSPNPEH